MSGFAGRKDFGFCSEGHGQPLEEWEQRRNTPGSPRGGAGP